MKLRTFAYVALSVGALGAVALAVGQMRRAEKRNTTPIPALQVGSAQVMQVKDLPGFIREVTENENHPPESRVAVRKYDLNHDGEDEWIVSDIDLYAYGGLERVYNEGERSTTIYQHTVQHGWEPLLYNINDSIKFIPTGKAGEYDEIEHTSNFWTTDEGYKGRRRLFVLRFRWIDGKYQICQCRDAETSEIVPCASLEGQGNRTLTEYNFIINEKCP
ncbi:MAG: hypothetical protein H0W76_28255 [Pyrinomonadaceae bacterium]|nr:hypothetical protein [Pyrinomonadaceae bacterium]